LDEGAAVPTVPTEPTELTVTRGRILIKFAGNDTVFGYLAQPQSIPSSTNFPDFTTDPSNATWFERELNATADGLFNIRKIVRFDIILVNTVLISI